MASFIYRILPTRANFAASLTEDERALMGRHFEYLTALHAEGRIHFVGRTENGDFGLVVFEAADLAEAEAIGRADPAVAGGLVRLEVNGFRIVDFG